MTLVAVYVRASTDKQESSPERQLDQIAKYCAEKGYRAYKTYEDHGLKGYDWERPAFQALLRDAAAGKFRGIVVDEPSRLSRDRPVKFIAHIAEPLMECGVWLESVSDGRQDWDDLGGLILTTVRADKSSGESANLGRRILSKWNLRAEQGRLFLGRPPYGYRPVLDDEGNRVGLEPDEDGDDPTQPAKVVRWLFKTYAEEDTSLKALAKELTARAVPTPQGGQWRTCTLHKFLTNRAYVGDYIFNRTHSGKFYRRRAGGQLVKSEKKVRDGCKRRIERNPEADWVVRPDSHPPLLDRDTFALVQAKLGENAARKASVEERNKYPLLRMLVCGHCGSWMTAHKKAGWPEPRYICGSNHALGTCHGYSVKEGVVLGPVLEVLEREFLDPAHRAGIAAAARDLEGEQRGGGQASGLRRTIARLEQHIKRAEENLALVPPNRVRGILDRIADWEAARAKAEHELGSLDEPPAEGLSRQIPTLLRGWRRALGGAHGPAAPLVREAVERVVLRFETRMVRVKPRHTLVEGTVHLRCGKTVPLEVGRGPDGGGGTGWV